ncbi:hypothetical protein [Flavobacterium flavigenum]|uniref:hypothetical protein n=1 Tax=Flavobacterium flavigenum TaxID=3003258 RepID=UPI0022AC4536|nr:hypothetical protein [Flavobacterium flavigenum]
MKKVLLSISFLGILSCSSDNETKRLASEDIVGNWHLIKIFEGGEEVIGYSCNAEYNVNDIEATKQQL